MHGAKIKCIYRFKEVVLYPIAYAVFSNYILIFRSSIYFLSPYFQSAGVAYVTLLKKLKIRADRI